jgi:threonine/homoserine efflux transporter RhtA
MDASGGVAGAGLVLILLLRPWRLRDEAGREYSALLAAILLGMLLVNLCMPA